MLAAENPSVDGHLAASTPRRRGMDRKPSKNANKNFIQARLPFKRLNSEPKENHSHKRPCAHAYPEPSDRENENESSPLPKQPLVNGRGPLDGFLSRRCPTASNKNMVIDLTEDNNMSLVKHLISPAPPSPCLPTKDKQQSKDKTASSEKSINLDQIQTHTVDCAVVDDDDEEEEEEEEEAAAAAADEDGHQTSISQIDTTQDSDSEPEEQNESGNVSSLGNKSALSASSVSSMSESSPEKSKSDDPTPTTTPTEPKTTPKIPEDQKKITRRSLKGLQEQEERLRLRQEKECQKEEAKAVKEKKKEEARKLKEEREREKREKREKDEREKREKKEKEEKEKADKLKAKEELRKSKLDQARRKRKREEDKRVKEEEKRLKEEKDRLKAEKAEITRFLQISKIQQAPKTLAAACGKFAPFEIKEHMSLAPLCRVQCADSVLEDLDRCLLNPSNNLNGLKDWIGQKPRQSGPTKRRRTDTLSECITLEGPKPEGVPDRKRYGPMKLLRFHENYRPAYWGTWSKKSTHISPRCPLTQDKDLLDYEVDSDEEWEEEEPGESLSHSEGEDEEEGGEDDDDDDGFFVPHGYLSEDEVALEEESGDLENQKLRQKVKAREWDELMSTKKKMKVLEPVVRGCMWEGEGPGLELLQPYAVCLVEPLPKADTSQRSAEELSQKCQREAQLLDQLLPLLHGNVNSSKVIITEFQEFCRQQTSSSSPPEPSSPQSSTENIPTRIQLKRLIKSNAVYEKRSTYRRCCWYVHTEVLSRLGQEALPLPCQWTYLITGAREESREEPQAATGSQGNSPTTPQTSSTTSSSNKRKSTGSMSITKFMKRCTDLEPTEADGFQADTEEDDEEDCVIISPQTGPNREKSSSDGDVLMEVTPSDAAALPLASAAPALATA